MSRRNEVIRRKHLVASPILLTCVTGLLADSTSRGKLGGGGDQLAAPLGGRAKAIALRTRVSFLRSNRDEKKLVGKVIILVEGGGREQRRRKEGRKINKERFLENCRR